MISRVVWSGVVAVALLTFTSTWFNPAQGADEPKSIAALEAMGAKFERDDKAPGKPVIAITGFRKFMKDDDLVHLKGLPDLKRLLLIGSGVTDAGLVHLKDLKKLENLDLGYAKLTDAGLIHLKDLTELKYLTLSGSLIQKVAIKGPGLAHLARLTKLEFLGLSNTDVDDDALVHLEKLKSLKMVGLSTSKVTAAGAKKLKAVFPELELN